MVQKGAVAPGGHVSVDSSPCGEGNSWKAARAGLSNSQRLAEPCLPALRQHPEAQPKLPIHQFFSTGDGFASQRPFGSVADIVGWHKSGEGRCWHLVGRGQQCC